MEMVCEIRCNTYAGSLRQVAVPCHCHHPRRFASHHQRISCAEPAVLRPRRRPRPDSGASAKGCCCCWDLLLRSQCGATRATSASSAAPVAMARAQLATATVVLRLPYGETVEPYYRLVTSAEPAAYILQVTLIIAIILCF